MGIIDQARDHDRDRIALFAVSREPFPPEVVEQALGPVDVRKYGDHLLLQPASCRSREAVDGPLRPVIPPVLEHFGCELVHGLVYSLPILKFSSDHGKHDYFFTRPGGIEAAPLGALSQVLFRNLNVFYFLSTERKDSLATTSVNRQ
jgi:hypothetical protein